MTPPCLSLCHTDGGFNCHWRINPFSGALNINLKPAHHRNRWNGKEPAQCWPGIYGIASFLWHSVFRWAGFGVAVGGWVGLVASRWLLLEKFCCFWFLWGPCVMTVCLHHRCDLCHQSEEPIKAEHAAVRLPETYKPWNYFHRCVLTMKAPKYKNKISFDETQ